jgi:hypothetical protein
LRKGVDHRKIHRGASGVVHLEAAKRVRVAVRTVRRTLGPPSELLSTATSYVVASY